LIVAVVVAVVAAARVAAVVAVAPIVGLATIIPRVGADLSAIQPGLGTVSIRGTSVQQQKQPKTAPKRKAKDGHRGLHLGVKMGGKRIDVRNGQCSCSAIGA
jgi:hypothetical protein